MEGYEGGGRNDTPDDIQKLRSQLDEIERQETLKHLQAMQDEERVSLRKKIMARGHSPVA